MQRSLRLAAVATLVLATAAFVRPAVAAETLKIGWTTSDSPNDPYAIGAHAFAEALEEAAPGRFDIRFFPSRQLGDEKEMLEGLKFGVLDMAIITNAVIANVEPAFMVNDLPFLYADEDQAHHVLDGPVGQGLLARLEGDKIVGLGFMEGGFRHMINNVRPVSQPADVAGVKFRVMQNPVFISMFSALGGNAVPMAWGEVFTAVQQGTIDGLEIPVPVIAAAKYDEVTHYLSLTRHTYSAIALLMAQRTFKKLSDDDEAAIRTAASKAVDLQRSRVAAVQQALVSDLESRGMAVNVVENTKPFRQAVTPVYDEFRDRIGAETMDAVLEATQ